LMETARPMTASKVAFATPAPNWTAPASWPRDKGDRSNVEAPVMNGALRQPVRCEIIRGYRRHEWDPEKLAGAQYGGASAHYQKPAMAGWTPSDLHDDGDTPAGPRARTYRIARGHRARKIELHCRLTRSTDVPRSLADFAKLVELFETRLSHSFGDPQFNTTNSMGVTLTCSCLCPVRGEGRRTDPRQDRGSKHRGSGGGQLLWAMRLKDADRKSGRRSS